MSHRCMRSAVTRCNNSGCDKSRRHFSFTIFLSSKVWATIDPIPTKYARRSEGRKYRKVRVYYILQPGVWTNILIDRISRSRPFEFDMYLVLQTCKGIFEFRMVHTSFTLATFSSCGARTRQIYRCASLYLIPSHVEATRVASHVRICRLEN